jgi:uncharacterized membrane protein YbhN (UPF0104 family)
MKAKIFYGKDTQSVYSIAFAVSVCTAVYLGYVDEGFNSFHFLQDPQNWIALLLYTIAIWSLYSGIIYLLDLAVRYTRKHKH